MNVEIKNGSLVITLPLQPPSASKSGKTLIVAGTGGFVKTQAEVNGKKVSIAVNAVIAKD